MFHKYCTRKLLLSIVVLKLLFKYFPQNYMLTTCLGRENLELFLGLRQKTIADPDLS